MEYVARLVKRMAGTETARCWILVSVLVCHPGIRWFDGHFSVGSNCTRAIRVTCVRAGQMYEEGKIWNVVPEARMAFGKTAMEAGINLRERPLSQFVSVTDAFRSTVGSAERDSRLGSKRTRL